MAYGVDDLAEKPSKAWFYFVIAFDDLFLFVLSYLLFHKQTYYYYYVQSITILASKHHLICLFK